MAGCTRKDAAVRLGVGIETLRYYEKLGLIGRPVRAANGYRVYSEADIRSIDHVLRMKQYGFTLGEIRKIMENARPDDDFKKSVVMKKLHAIQMTIGKFEKQKKDLQAFLKSLR